MGNDDDGLPIRLHVPHDREQLIGLLGGEHRRGFIQDQDIRPPVEHLDDLQGLLFRDRHIVDLFVRLHHEAVPVAYFFHLEPHVAKIHHPVFVEAQDDIFRSSKHIHQLKMLMDHADPKVKGVLGRTYDDLPPVHIDLSAIG